MVVAITYPGVINIESDISNLEYRKMLLRWKLNPVLFLKIVEKFGKPDIVLFATRIKEQLDR